MTWHTPTSPPLSVQEQWKVHQIHALLGAVGCTAAVTDMYDLCAGCGRGKFRWLKLCGRCYRTLGVG